jgi:ketosteroid isomerase-like protein
MPSSSTAQTQATLDHHLQSIIAKDIDALMEDYVEQSVLYMPDTTVRGLDDLRNFFTGFLTLLTPEFMADFEMSRQEVDGEIAYTVWNSGSAAPLGTDTFVVRDGKIVVQTAAVYMPG